jgi:formylglycine-generating enzyme required for sulfatase activity
VLRRIDGELAHKLQGGRDWIVTPLGHTMVIIPGPTHFLMGASKGDPWRKTFEDQHFVQIPHAYELAATEVTVAQFRPFLEKNPDLMGRPDFAKQLDGSPDMPIVFVGWFDAVRYCNWLSAREGLGKDQWCYLPTKDGGYSQGLTIAGDYSDRAGYRLPTEPEWEYACRAGTSTSRSFGETEFLMSDYAVYVANSDDRARVVGSFRPNGFGIFDMHGNAFEWCQETYRDVAGETDGRGDVATDLEPRVTRGGTCLKHPRYLRSSARNSDVPNYKDYVGGFRIARSRLPNTTARRP